MRTEKQIIGLDEFQQALITYVTFKMDWDEDAINAQETCLGVNVWLQYDNMMPIEVLKLVDSFARANGLQIALISCDPHPHMIETDSGDWVESNSACPCLYIDCYPIYKIAPNGDEIGYVFNEGIKVPK